MVQPPSTRCSPVSPIGRCVLACVLMALTLAPMAQAQTPGGGPVATETPASRPPVQPTPARLPSPVFTPAMSAGQGEKALPVIIGKTVTTREWRQSARWAPARVQAASPSADALSAPIKPYAGGAPPITYTVSGDPHVHRLTSPDRARVVDLRADVSSDPATRPDEALAMPVLAPDPATARDHAPTYMAQAVSHVRRGNIARALVLIEQAAAMDPDNPAIQAALGEILIQTRNWPQALRAYENAMRLADVLAMRDRYLSRYAAALYLQGNRPLAVARLASLLPSEPGARLGPAAYGAYFIYGALLQELGRAEAAIAPLQIASTLNPESATTRLTLGLAYELTGQRQAAREQYQRALSLNPASQEASQALQRVQAGAS